MEELYWITRLNGVIALLICLGGFFASFAIYCLCYYYEYEYGNKYDKPKHLKKSFIYSLLSLAVFVIAIFIPTEKDMLMIYGVGGTIDYIKTNETAKEIPDKCIKAIDLFLEQYTIDNKNTTNKQ